MQNEYLVPASILIGCSIIGVALYLRPHDPPPAGAPAEASARRAEASASERRAEAPAGAKPGEMPPTSAPGLDPAQMTTQGIGPRSAPAAVQAEAEKAAAAALEVEKKTNLLPKCWLPALQKSPKPAFARFNLDLTFDAQGMQIASGVNEDRSAPRSDVVGCIQNLTLQIPATGQVVRVMVPLTFP